MNLDFKFSTLLLNCGILFYSASDVHDACLATEIDEKGNINR